MTSWARIRSSRGLRQWAVPAVVVLVAAPLLARAISSAAQERASLIVIALLLAAIGAAALASWRTGLYLFLGWLVLEDLLRKYLGNNMVLYFGKDALFALVVASYLLLPRAERGPVLRPAFLTPFLLFLGLGVVQVFNPASPSLWYGVLGLKLYFLYVPLLFLGFALPRSLQDVRILLTVLAVIVVVVGGLGIAQGIVGLDFLNPEDLAPELHALGRELRYAPLSGAEVARATSVFVSEGRYGSFMLFCYIMTLGATAMLAARQLRPRLLMMGAAAVALVATLLHGSRAGFLYALLTSVTLGVLYLVRWQPPAPGRRAAGRLLRGGLAAALVFVVALAAVFPRQVGARWAFYNETITPWSPASELWWRLWDYPVMNFRGAAEAPGGLIGRGIGTGSIGVQYVVSRLGAPPPPPPVESGYGTLLLELGLFGPLLWLAWTVPLVVAGWRVVRSLRYSSVYPVAASILWFVFCVLFPMTFGALNAYQNFLYTAGRGLLVGLLFRRPALAAADAEASA